MAREVKLLNKNWLFHIGEIEERLLPNYGGYEWDPVTVPHTWNDIDTFVPTRGYYRGIGWYKRYLEIDESMMGKALLLEFEGVYGSAEIWINGVYKGRFLAGYTGCLVDITKDIRVGFDNLLAVRVDNRHSEEILPARVEPDYYLYGGIYREVKLIVANKTHIAWRGVRIKTDEINGNMAVISAEADFVKERKVKCKLDMVIYDMNDAVIAAQECTLKDNTTFVSQCIINDVNLWSPDNPYLYRAEFRLTDKLGQILDFIDVNFGVREFEFHPEKGFYLNGKPLKLNGLNRHQCFPGLGNALPISLQYEDARLIKEMGANIVRNSHYPHHPSFLDACDRLGLLVYTEIATWQTIGEEKFFNSAKQMMKEMIQRDYNHPSIIIWGMMNEGRSRELFLQLHEIAHNMDPDRMTSYCENKLDEGKEIGTVTIPDVLSVNYQLEILDEFHKKHPNYCLFIGEYTNSTIPRKDPDKLKEQVYRIANDYEFIEERDYISGGTLWSMHDFGTDYEWSWPVQTSGVMDMYRIPKYSYYYMKSCWRKDPIVFIAGHWTMHGKEGKDVEVLVISNCDEVELFINGVSQGKKTAKRIFKFNVKYEPGTIKAVASKDGQNVEAVLQTAGKPEYIKIEANKKEIPADGNEVSIITATVTDKSGVLVPDADWKIYLNCEGDSGKLCGLGGENIIHTKMGIGRIAFKAGTKKGIVEIKGEANGITSNICKINMI
ncbi:MAG TPA: glycoside hydrolase family 2 protein [Clostridiales bacterium]|nr:glycoside hydrolase family 2 protein [Clostridiales bacterium]